MTDYWLSKLFFDLQQDPEAGARVSHRHGRASSTATRSSRSCARRCSTTTSARIAPLVNAYLLRFYFQIRGMPEGEFIARLHALKAKGNAIKRPPMAESRRRVRRQPRADHRAQLGDDAGRATATSSEAGFDEIGRRLKACRPDLLGRRSRPTTGSTSSSATCRRSASASARSTTGRPSRSCEKVYPHQRLRATPRSDAICSTPRSTAISSRRCRTGCSSTTAPASRSGASGSISDLPIVPVLVNDLEEPMPSIRRCLAWGRLLRQAIELSRAAADRGPRHRRPEPLDRRSRRWAGSTRSSITPASSISRTARRDGWPRSSREALPRTGNGAHEIRDWVIAPRRGRQQGLRADRLFPEPGDAGRRRRFASRKGWGRTELPPEPKVSTKLQRTSFSGFETSAASTQGSGGSRPERLTI